MIRVVPLTFIVAMGIVLGGCSNMNKSAAAPATGSDVLNVAAAPAPAADPLITAAPISDAPIAMAASATPMQSGVAQTSGASTASKTYVVKKGDTLFSIAKNQLGSGRDWQKIVSANPGLDPKKLKVGQSVTLPS